MALLNPFKKFAALGASACVPVIGSRRLPNSQNLLCRAYRASGSVGQHQIAAFAKRAFAEKYLILRYADTVKSRSQSGQPAEDDRVRERSNHPPG